MPRPTIFPNQVGELHIASVYYDFDQDGGGVVGEPFPLPGILPHGALIINSIVHILNSLTGDAAATVAVTLGTLPLTPQETLDKWTSEGAGLKVTDIFGPGDYDPHLLAEDSQVYLMVDGQPLTSGRLGVHILYFMSPYLPAQLEPAKELVVPEEEPPTEDPPADPPPAEDPPAEDDEECDPEVEAASAEDAPKKAKKKRW